MQARADTSGLVLDCLRLLVFLGFSSLAKTCHVAVSKSLILKIHEQAAWKAGVKQGGRSRPET